MDKGREPQREELVVNRQDELRSGHLHVYIAHCHFNSPISDSVIKAAPNSNSGKNKLVAP